MPVNNIQGMKQVTPIMKNVNVKEVPNIGKENMSFSNVLKSAIEKVNEAENESNVKTEALAEGKIDNLHEVMLSAQKANVMIDTAVQFQQKAVDTYNEIMRMQI